MRKTLKISVTSDNKIILIYSPRDGTGFINSNFENGNDSILLLKRTVEISKSDIKDYNEEFVSFVIAEPIGEYYKVKNNIFSLKHDFYFSNMIHLDIQHFICSSGNKKESPLFEIDQHIENNLYIENDYDKCVDDNHIPFELYNKIISVFPKQTELDKYVGYRINYIIEEFVSGAGKRVEEYNKFIEKKHQIIEEIKNERGFSPSDEFDALLGLKANILLTVKKWLTYAIDHSNEYEEEHFMDPILNVLLTLFPEYIVSVKKVKLQGMDEHDKIPDFILINASGVVDVLEIKRPDKDILRKTPYRDNYQPSAELAGSAIQVEKYISCLQRNANSIEENPPLKIKERLSSDFKLNIINPRGLILVGRSKDLNDQQKRDFEIIRRHYKHIADVITYDDLIERIDVVIREANRIKSSNT